MPLLIELIKELESIDSNQQYYRQLYNKCCCKGVLGAGRGIRLLSIMQANSINRRRIKKLIKALA